MRVNAESLKRIMAVDLEISRIRDIDLLLEKILQEARQITDADAGSIYTRDKDLLKFSYTQNDTLQQRLPQGKKLLYSTFTIPIDRHSIAGYVAKTGETVNIADVRNIPPGAPYSFNASFDEKSGYLTRTLLALPLQTNRGEVVGVLQLINARNRNKEVVPFPADDVSLLLHFANNAALAVDRANLTRAMILRMIKMAELRDPKETGPHVNRVASCAVLLYENWALQKGIPQDEIDRNKDSLRMAAMLHDVGKVAISDMILKKPARFTPEEFEIMKGHTLLGARLFEELYSEFDDLASMVALNHHERWDGNGYPGHIDPLTGLPLPGREKADGGAMGKKGEEIPLTGRIVAIADVYDALCSKRCYKEAWDEGEVVKTLQDEAGRQFDPELVEIFLQNLDAVHHIYRMFPEEAE
jgi:HD-GYP domain-containing protein (c-di-GMP phosphodiesterase class II)